MQRRGAEKCSYLSAFDSIFSASVGFIQISLAASSMANRNL
jgi:hypothetical protein